MIKNIVIVDWEPLSPRRVKIFCINELINAGFNVQHVYISPIMNMSYDVPDRIISKNEFLCKTLFDLENVLQSYLVEETFVFIEFFYSQWKYRKIRKIISELHFATVRFERFGNTSLCDESGTMDRIRKLIYPSKVWNFFLNHICLKIYNRINKINNVDFFFNSGEKNFSNVKINHPDYDDFLRYKRSNSNVSIFPKNSYIVFIDTFFGRHPDEKNIYGAFLGDNLLWQEKLCKYFALVEQKFGVEVVIAAHPKSDYANNEWGGRKIIKNKTLDLISNSLFVLQDISTSIAYSILCEKKVYMIATDEFYLVYKLQIDNLRKKLNLPFCRVENNDLSEYFNQEYSFDKFNEYKYGYLTSPETEDKLTSDILIDWLKNT